MLGPGLAGGLLGSLIVHGMAYAALLCVPWRYEPLFGDGLPPSVPPGVSTLLAATSLSVAALAVYAVRAQRVWARPVNGFAMASAVCNFTAMLVGAYVSQLYTSTGGAHVGFLTAPLAFVFAAFGAAVAFALAAVVSLARRRTDDRRPRGWILVLYGLYIPPWLGGLAWHELIHPLHLLAPTEIEAVLPEVEDALPYFEAKAEVRPRVQLLADGTILAPILGTVLFDPLAPDGGRTLAAFLTEQARLMPKATIDIGDGAPTSAPDNPLLILADAKVPFDRILGVMRACAAPDVRIWKFDLGLRRTEAPWLGVVTYRLPRDGTTAYPTPRERERLRLERAGADGRRTYLFAGAEYDTLSALAPRLRREIGDASELMLVELRENVTWKDVAGFLTELDCLGTEIPSIQFAALAGD